MGKHHTNNQRQRARMLYEADGLSIRACGEEVGAPAKTVEKWKKKDGWVKRGLTEVVQEVALNSRMELAREVGIDERAQFQKAAELMQAGVVEETVATGPNGEPVPVQRAVPDYKIQNEGLKRAMELTGTKIERKEHEHKHSGEVVHNYELPKKQDV